MVDPSAWTPKGFDQIKGQAALLGVFYAARSPDALHHSFVPNA
jgi:hypothetical protein